MFPSDPDVLVIGAGCAGIAAARELAKRGRSCIVLEGGPRVGGRAYTESTSLGVPFDHGASWLHQANDNPLTPLARALGLVLVDHDALRQRRLHAHGRLATAEEHRDFAAAEQRFLGKHRGRRRRRHARPPGRRGRAARRPLGCDHRPLGRRADLRRRTPAHEPARLCRHRAGRAEPHPARRRRRPRGTRWRSGLPIRTGAACRAHPLECARRDARRAPSAPCPHGRRSSPSRPACWRPSGITFDPPLPVETQEAIHALPLGLLTKIAFRASHPDAPDLPPYRQPAPRRGRGRATGRCPGSHACSGTR